MEDKVNHKHAEALDQNAQQLFTQQAAPEEEKPAPKKTLASSASKAAGKEEQPKTPANAPARVPAIPAQLSSLSPYLLSPKKAFLAAGGTEEQFAREINFAVQLLMNNEFLVSCAKQNPDYLVEAVKNVALTGLTLNPELRLAYLVPRKGKIYLTSSYMGKREILMRSGCVKWIEVALVFEGDQFELLKGLNPMLNHRPDPWADQTKSSLRGGYWVATLPNGTKVFDTVNIQRITEIQNRSEAVKSGKTSPWDTDYFEMVKKTILNAAFKQLPKTDMSEAVLKALSAESSYDNEVFEDWKTTQQPKDTFTEYEEV